MEIRPILSTLLRHKTAATLIVLEIALTCAIICNALFMIGERITQVNEVSGIAEDELVRVQLTAIGNDDNAEAQTRSDLASLRGLPGVTAATVLNQVPFVNSSWNSGVRLSQEQTQSTLNATTYMAEDQFVETLGLKLVAGRDFEPDEYLEFETVNGTPGSFSIPATIITRVMAEKLFPGEDPIGKTFYSWGEEPIRVVGVVEHLVRPSMQGGPAQREYTMVFPLRPTYNLGGNYVIRTSPERRQEVLEAAVDLLRKNGPNRIILDENTKTFEQLRSEFYQQPRSMAWLLAIVCIGLLLITALGIVGLASFWVQQRTKQIGVRRALGATKGQILRYFQTENFLLATIGIVLGMLLAYGINQLLMGKYELPRLPLYYLPIGALALWLLGQIAVFGPARRAAAVPPAIATRSV
ncbi:FtsX-like permease family protein [Luteimonas viscosa]|uniref:FtsX-like permease family protein n=1 Tax=Luteimonas viscosa TaxID=1132694 RepID=A0A5D4XN75_9GAMM|nr:FtsX-like permease family protein [Luteimonas viscosa]TYT26096.1 FtsX-like permease family protein [Luteimonas viscosa]